MMIRSEQRPQAGPPTPMSRGRLLFVLAMMFLLALVTAFRLVDLQLIHHSDYTTRAQNQYTNRREIEPERGLIFDRRGNNLVTNLPNYWSVGVRPGRAENVSLLSSQLADILEVPAANVQNAFNRRGSFVWVERKIDPRRAQMIRALGSSSIGLQRETLRRYPYGRTGSQVVGYVTVDNDGLGGVEGLFDEALSGQPGWEVVQKDAWRREILDPNYPRLDPVDGGKVVLSIDINAQAIAEEELDAAVEKAGARGGTIVVTRPATGEILAIASSPRFDPNNVRESDPWSRKNRAVTDLYEPGSTFKVVAFAGLIERNLVDLDELVFCENGRWKIADRVIRDSHPYGWLTARQVLANSSNIGTAILADRLSKRDYYTVIRDFGFGQETGIDLPGESGGIMLQPSKWSGVSMANMAMGHGIAITALQLAMAYGAIANDGFLMEPILVLSTTDAEGKVDIRQPTRVRRVLKPSTARTLRTLLTDAVELGTGSNAIIEGLKVAGKTGTAQMVDEENHTYFQDRYHSSFAGFVPADRPELCAVVVIDDPKNGHYGGAVAAPVFRNVMERLVVTLPRQDASMPGEELDESEGYVEHRSGVEVPSLVALSSADAASRLEALGLVASFAGEGSIVCGQNEMAGSRLTPGSVVELKLGHADRSGGEKAIVPDVRGMALRQAVATLTREGFRVEVEGSGVVRTQSLLPGKASTVGRVCMIRASQPGGHSA
ncbi:PASTA domain-containing protein [bacterium]|nr:PASTA domain-containing protein [bacterium]